MSNKLWRLELGVILALQFLLSMPAQGSGDWPTTRFKAYVGNPYSGLTENYEDFAEILLEFQDPINTLTDQQVNALEEAMSTAAKWYADRGFPAPRISETDQTDTGEEAYRFYVCKPYRGQKEWADYLKRKRLSQFIIAGVPINPPWDTCIHPGKYASACGDDSRRSEYFYVNYDKVFDKQGRITERGYQTMAHELMHALFPGTGLGQSAQSCDLNGWITEGLADAVGYHIAWEEFGKKGKYQKSTASGYVMRRHGSRPYFRTLAQERGAEIALGGSSTTVLGDYNTSSFWRYVADSYSANNGWDVLMANSENPGNRITTGLLDRGVTPGKSKDWKREVEWLDRGLREIFGFGLDKMYGNFVTFYSHSMPTVPNLTKLHSREAKLDYWTTRIFEPCQTVDISNIGSHSVTFDLKPLTSICIKVKPTNFGGSTQVTFAAEGTDPTFLGSILIGRADTDLLLLVRGNVIQSATPPSTHSVDWRDFPQDGADYTYYILSNIAPKPQETRAGKGKITISIPGFWSNYAPQMPSPGKVAPAPAQPTFDPKAPTLKQRKAATDKMLKQQIEFDKNSLNHRVSSASEVSRQVNVHDCPDPFVYTVCGKHLQISLSLKPGSYGQLGMASSQGGMAAQFFGSMMSMSSSSPLSEAYIKELEARMDQIPGSKIQIAIPLVDYGFVGSFSNASISVSAPGDRTLRAIGPPDANRRTRLTGNVTIEEFSPTILRGTFSGLLAEIVQGPDGRPVYTTRDTVQGNFVTVSPWTGDERIARPVQTRDEVLEDLANTLGLDPKTVKSLEDQGMIPREDGSQGSGTAGTVKNAGECSCACEDRHLANDLCEFFCEDEFAACE